MPSRRATTRYAALLAVVCLVPVTGCVQEMADQPSYRPLQASSFFKDDRASRPLVAGTIARGHLQLDEHLYQGRVDGQFAQDLPFELTPQLLERGQQRYNIFCAVCHDQAGTGDGMIVRRGYHRPPSFHDERLRTAALGYFFEVTTNGYRFMPDYAAQIPVNDRWAIAAYIRVLQLSQHASPGDVPREEMQKLEALAP